MTKLLSFGLVLCASLAFADNYPRQPGIDAQHYTFRITLTDAGDEVEGEATVDLRFVQSGVTQVVLDLTSLKDGKGMTVAAVSSGGATLKFQHSADRLVIPLDSTPAPGERRQFTVKYHGIAGTGLHIAKNKFGDRTFFSWNWPDPRAPVAAHDRSPLRQSHQRIPSHRARQISGGRQRPAAGGTRSGEWHAPHALEAVHADRVVAERHRRRAVRLARISAPVTGIPLQTWVFPQDRDNGIVTFEEPTRQAMEFFTSHIGPYPTRNWPTSRPPEWAAEWSTPARSFMANAA